ncbi:MAG: hypothetical protein JNK47_11135 [Mesorhizobium sp.]|nr:hypothetical protein [Mesorhizobium sp.]MBL8577773.1 hypothetical protein [Mesorhizobium sp.]
MPSVRRNSYFNDPAFAQAASNLSALFEPPSGADAAGWATANAKREEAKRLQDYYDYQRNPGWDRETSDRMGVGAGAFQPNQSYYSVDQGNATSRANNAADNARALQQTEITSLTDLFKPVSEDAVRPEIPADVAGRLGVDRALPAVQGNRSPLSETEWKAAQGDRLLSDDQILDLIVGAETPVQAIGEDGRGRFMSPGAAVRTGAQPYEKPSDAKFDNYLAVGPDGNEKRFLGYVGDDGRIFDADTRQPVPRVVRKESTGGGMSFETDGQGGIKLSTGNAAGLTTSRVGDLQRQETENTRAVAELTTLFDTLRPDDLGVAGNVNELLTDYGAQMFPTLARPDVAGTRAQLGATTQGIARAIMQDERLSDSDRRAVEQLMVSRGFDESLAGARAKLSTLIAMSAYRAKYANTVRSGGERLPPLDRAMLGRLVDENAISPAVAQSYAETVLSRTPHSPNSALPGVDIQQGVDAVTGDGIRSVGSVDEAMQLPSGTKFRTPDGRVKVRP